MFLVHDTLLSDIGALITGLASLVTAITGAILAYAGLKAARREARREVLEALEAEREDAIQHRSDDAGSPVV